MLVAVGNPIMPVREFVAYSCLSSSRRLRTGIAATALLAASAVPLTIPEFRAEIMAGDASFVVACENPDAPGEGEATQACEAKSVALPDLFGETASPSTEADRAQPPATLAALTIPPLEIQRIAPQPEPDISRPAAPADEISAYHVKARPAAPGVSQADMDVVRQALAEYRRGKLAEGDVIASRAEDEAARLALEWAAIRLGRQSLGFPRLARFHDRNADFPMADWVRRRAEEALFVEKRPQQTILDFFRHRTPELAAGSIALARVLASQGDEAGARDLVRKAWREQKTNSTLRAAILKEFPSAISNRDKQHLAEKLIYQGETAEGVRIAATAGPTAAALAQILSASVNETGGALAMVQKLEAEQQAAPAAIFARAQHFRRTNQPAAAAQAMLQASNDPDKIVDGDEWWIERRMLTRKLLDAGDAEAAYKVAAGHHAQGNAHRVDAEVHAGWVALRFLNRPEVALRHFAIASAIATAPPSLARAAYWRGRATEVLGDANAFDFYKDSAVHAHTYHGQLAAARLPKDWAAPALPPTDADELERVTRGAGLRAIRVLLEADARDLAQPLIADAAAKSRNREEALAVGDLVARFGLPRLTLLAGKSAMQRGIHVKEHAFPTFGVPEYPETPETAEPAIVYSIARQESEFDAKAVSHAGARGLMQLMPATAQRTASRFKIPYDINALTTDPALNARIGATHLGELFGEYRGSYILSFAAYNAGGGRVKEWINAYGDPRDPHVDKVDWIERIPITETRHYVQKVLENVQVYRSRLKSGTDADITADMLRGARRAKSDLAQTGQ